MEQKKKLILLAGPTGSGKSKLAIKLANHYYGEIINADSMQIYKEISILTSKPNSRFKFQSLNSQSQNANIKQHQPNLKQKRTPEINNQKNKSTEKN